MSKVTGNYNLIMPELTDSPPDITAMNPNWQKIDSKLKEQEEKITETVNLVSNEAVARASADNTLNNSIVSINTSFATNVRSTVLTGLTTATSATLTVTDTILAALGKLQAQIAAKANLASPSFTGTVVLPSTTSIGNVSSTELGYVDGVTSAIQSQLNAKANLTSPVLTGTPTIGGNIIYHAGNITVSTTAPGSSLAEGYQHQVY
ncbi:MAG: hypothetical protein K0Q87_3816 [Neobacillus sp.]|nr:hypothetical protein [Neobacillus sp.]